LAAEVIQASTDFDGTARAPMRIAEARITLGVVAARQGDLAQAVHLGEQALSGDRKSLPSLMMVVRDLTKVLNARYPDEQETRLTFYQLHALSVGLAIQPAALPASPSATVIPRSGSDGCPLPWQGRSGDLPRLSQPQYPAAGNIGRLSC
jgi:hypothetical protein